MITFISEPTSMRKNLCRQVLQRNAVSSAFGIFAKKSKGKELTEMFGKIYECSWRKSLNKAFSKEYQLETLE